MNQKTQSIEKVCVIGAGTMGTGIAAQAANAGLDVLLLDVAGSNDAPNMAAESGIERIVKSEPPLLMLPENIERINAGNIRDDLPLAGKCDWIVEAVVERLDIKRELYLNLVPHLKEGALVSSNTSTIPISLLMRDMPEQLRRNFCITHFFNPVRYMRLLEIAKGADTSPECIERLDAFCDRQLGKGVVHCADTPGFLANRVGVFALQAAISEAIRLDLSVEEADAIFGRPMGMPKTGAFGLYDLIGLDLMADVVRSMRSILPPDDAFHPLAGENSLINRQIELGFTGNKGKGGFYANIDGKQMSLDLSSGEWKERNRGIPQLAIDAETRGMEALVEGNERLSQFAWQVLASILTYSASLVPDVTRSPQDIDDAMKLGYNWTQGPFEMMDMIGVEQFVTRLEQEGRSIPKFLEDTKRGSFYLVADGSLMVRHWDGNYQPVSLPAGATRFHMLRRTLEPVEQNQSASLYHLEDGIRLVEFHSKANALDAGSMEIVSKAAHDPGEGIIIHNDGAHFSAGVNLHVFLEMIEAEDWDGIDRFLIDFQQAVSALRYCPVPVIGTPSGLALGGGFEVLAHCDCIVAHANVVMGLVETMVGLVPGGGGVKETYLSSYRQSNDWQKAAWQTFNQIGYSTTATSPDLAARLGYFNPARDKQVMNRDRLLNGAKEALKDLKEGYQPPDVPKMELAGAEAFDAMDNFLVEGREKGKFLDHDVTVAREVAWIVTGGPDFAGSITETEMFARERTAFMRLSRSRETKARIEYLLETGTPLRN